MKVFVIAIVLCLLASSSLQSGSFEKQAMSVVQRMLVSSLDAELPKRPFAAWFNQLIGPEAGVVWQLTECGERIDAPGEAGQDLPACAEANAVLPNGNKVIIAISVGTFKKGLTGEPSFFRAVVERDERLYQVRRLRDLPEMLHAREGLIHDLPDILASLPSVKLSPYLPSLATRLATMPSFLPESVTPPTPSSLQQQPSTPSKPQKVLEGVLRGNAIAKANPVYPASARSMNAFGTVEVQVTISEEGRVIDAKAISGHPALRNAAVEAARKWVFKPTTLNGSPIKVESILSFVFAASSSQ